MQPLRLKDSILMKKGWVTMKKISSALLALLVLLLHVHIAEASASMTVWTDNALVRYFKDSPMPAGASQSITLHAAKNEYESSQILLRSNSSFTTNSVTFTNLTSGSNTIDSSNLSYKFQDYMHFNNYGNKDWPDPLSNNKTQNTAANTTQGIWVTTYVPKGSAAGTYTGSATVNTTAGNFTVNISLIVYNVQIPDAKDGVFSYGTWNTQVLRWADHSLETSDYIQEQYGYTKFSTEWWSLIGKMADNMKETRQTMVTVPLDLILFGNGTALNNNGTYTFGWDKFDKFVQTFIDRGNIKILRGFSLLEAYFDNPRVFVIEKDANGILTIRHEDVNSAPSNNFLNQMLPALKAHLDAKGWTNMWRQSISDEAKNGSDYQYAVNKLRTYFGASAKTIDAILDRHLPFEGNINTWIPVTDYYQNNKAYFDSRQAAGDEVWTYVCVVPLPSDGWMNRFIDVPYSDPRMLIWGNYKFGLNGFYHWGYDYWNTTDGYGLNPNSLGPWGDGFIIYPDPANANVKTSVRALATRDGIEDYELFKILERKDADIAQSIADAIVTGFNKYNKDPNAILAKRMELLSAAADKLPVGTKYEAENAALTGAQTSTNGSGYSGTGFVRLIDNPGDKVSFKVQSHTAGSHKVIYKYSNGMGADQTLGVYVNGTFVKNVTFPATGYWDTTWSALSDSLNLATGSNTIELKYASGNGFVDPDYIVVYEDNAVKFEAENAAMIGAEVSSKGSGYSGTGFARLIDAPGDSVTFSVYNAVYGIHQVDIRYANGMGSNQSLGLYANGTFIKNVIFPSTGTWDTVWGTLTENVKLNAGSNTIELKYGSGNGFVDPDYIVVYNGAKYEAENATLAGAEVSSNGSGFSGSGFVRLIDTVGDKASFAVTVAAGGTHRVDIRYSNGMGSNQSLGLYVNGTLMKNVIFPPTGTWDTTWGTLSENINLNTGSNTIELKYGTGNGFVDPDYILVF